MCPSFTLRALVGYKVKCDTVPPNHRSNFNPFQGVNSGLLKLSFYPKGLILTSNDRVLRCLGSTGRYFRGIAFILAHFN